MQKLDAGLRFLRKRRPRAICFHKALFVKTVKTGFIITKKAKPTRESRKTTFAYRQRALSLRFSL
jgi:hypothetical protein